MAPKPRISIVGPGRLARALFAALRRAQYEIDEVISKDTKAPRPSEFRTHLVSMQKASLDAYVVWFCVPDGQIARAAADLAQSANWRGKIALHSSGALASDELVLLRRQGAAVASAHPLMTFVAGSSPSFAGVPFALEGDPSAVRMARRIVNDLGGTAFPVRKRDKAIYHAWGTAASPLLVAGLVAAERMAEKAGLSARDAREKMLPMVAQTIANYAALGPANAFSGPIVRGDAATLKIHLRALRKLPEVRDAYMALARVALRYLPVRNRKQLEKVLGRAR